MRIVKRRVPCYGCRGHSRGEYNPGFCRYGFKTEFRNVNSYGITKSGKMSVLFPAEPCPRPRNYDEHVDALQWEFDHRPSRIKS